MTWAAGGQGAVVGRSVKAVVAGLAVVLLLLLAGCTGDDGGDMPGLAASPSAEVTPTATPTPTPSGSQIAGTVVDLSDPELGIVFEELPDLDGDEADVYNWIATYRFEYWRTLATTEPSPAFSMFTAPEVQARMADLAAENAAEELRFDGTFHVTIGGITVDGDTARGTACDDYRDVTIEDAAGPRTLAEEEADAPVLLEIALGRNPAGDGLWTVLSSEWIGAC